MLLRGFKRTETTAATSYLTYILFDHLTCFGHSQLFLDKKRDLNVSTSKIVFLKVIINWALIHYLHGFNYSALCWSRMSATRLKKCLGETDLKIHEGVLGFPDNCQQGCSNLSATYCTHDVTQYCACSTHSVDSLLSTWRHTLPCMLHTFGGQLILHVTSHLKCTLHTFSVCSLCTWPWCWLDASPEQTCFPAAWPETPRKCLFKNCCFSLCSSSRNWHIM